MKIFSLIIVLFYLFLFKVTAQSYHDGHFKYDIMIGSSTPKDDSLTTAFNFSVEPHYILSNSLSLGLRLESFFTNKVTYSLDRNQKITSSINSICPTIDFYLGNKFFIRPFISAGFGMFYTTKPNFNDNVFVNGPYYNNNSSTINTVQFGGFPRIGIEIWHFRLVAEYDIVSSNENYLSLKAGGFFGGNRRRIR